MAATDAASRRLFPVDLKTGKRTQLSQLAVFSV
jgi:hypothetical protein